MQCKPILNVDGGRDVGERFRVLKVLRFQTRNNSGLFVIENCYRWIIASRLKSVSRISSIQIQQPDDPIVAE